MFNAARALFADYYPKRLHLFPKKWTPKYVPLLSAAYRDQAALHQRLKLETAGLDAFAPTLADQ